MMDDDDGPSYGQYAEWDGLIDAAGVEQFTVWRTREGQLIPITEMKDSHLLNTIRMLRGKSPIGTTFKCDPVSRRDWLNALSNEAYRRGLSVEPPDKEDPIHE